MTTDVLSDDAIARLTPEQRRELIGRLSRPIDQIVPSAGFIEWARRVRLGLMIGGTICLIPWIAFLAVTLPNSYEAHNWSLTWVGFDAVLVVMMASTAVLGWKRRQLLILTAFATGILLICDAWFDVMTSASEDLWVALATALFAELPMAAILIGGTLRLMRIAAMRNWLLDAETPLWQLRIPDFAAPRDKLSGM